MLSKEAAEIYSKYADALEKQAAELLKQADEAEGRGYFVPENLRGTLRGAGIGTLLGGVGGGLWSALSDNNTGRILSDAAFGAGLGGLTGASIGSIPALTEYIRDIDRESEDYDKFRDSQSFRARLDTGLMGIGGIGGYRLGKDALKDIGWIPDTGGVDRPTARTEELTKATTEHRAATDRHTANAEEIARREPDLTSGTTHAERLTERATQARNELDNAQTRVTELQDRLSHTNSANRNYRDIQDNLNRAIRARDNARVAFDGAMTDLRIHTVAPSPRDNSAAVEADMQSTARRLRRAQNLNNRGWRTGRGLWNLDFTGGARTRAKGITSAVGLLASIVGAGNQLRSRPGDSRGYIGRVINTDNPLEF